MGLTCTLIHGDCLEVMPTLLPRHDLVIADLPFGASAYAWDAPLELPRFWRAIRYTACVAFANRRFMNQLIESNPRRFKYELIWDQMRGWTPMLAAKMPMRCHTYICVFAGEKTPYNPQMSHGHARIRAVDGLSRNYFFATSKNARHIYDSTQRHPLSILRFPNDKKRRNNKTGTRRFTPTHPSSKPIALCDWLVRSYSHANDLICDPTAGCNASALAAINAGRHVVCIEKDPSYFAIGEERVRKHVRDNNLDVRIEVRK